jgi:putative ABC transport system permease protein
MRRAALLALLSHWRRQPFQLLTLVLGLALATGLWSAVQAINAEARASFSRAAAQLGTDRGQFLSAASGNIALRTYVSLRRAGWRVTPLLEGRVRLGDAGVSLLGVDVLSYPVRLTPGADQPGIAPADLLARPGRLFASAATRAHIGQDAALPPIIVSEQVPEGYVMTDIATAARLLNRPGGISRLLVLPDQPEGLEPLAALVPELRLQPADGAAETARLTDSFLLNLTTFGLLSFVVGLFIVHGSIGLAFQQRRGMFRTLRALGLPLRHLAVLVLAELALLALLSGALGLVIGYLVAAALLPDVAATLRGLYGAPVGGGLVLRPIWFAGGLGMALLGAGVAGAQGLWQLLALPILAAPGAYAQSAIATRNRRRMALAGLAMIAAGGGAVWLLDGLLAGFAFLGGLMLGAALILPLALELLLGFAGARARGVIAEWVWADLRAQLPGLSLALMALLLALATNIGVGTMVASFRLTFTGWLDQRLASELYVTANSDAQGRDMQAWLDPRVDAILPIRFAETRINERPARVYGILDHSTYRDNWPLLAAVPDVWERIAGGEAALINEQLARRAGLKPGDRMTVAADWSIIIAGIYSDYGNPTGQMIIGINLLLARFGAVPERQFGIRIAPGKAAALAADLRRRFDLPATAVVDQAAIKASSLAVFEKTFVVTAALNVLTLGVASFAILTSLLTLWSMRLPQLAPVWAQGLTRAGLARLEVLRSLALAALTALLALPLGLALAWALLAIINVEAFGWRLPMYLFPLDWLMLGALALLAGGVAALIPARRLRRIPPAHLLKVFANER